MRYFDPSVSLRANVPDYSGITDSIRDGMELGSQIKQHRQSGILSQLLAQNTGADGQVDLNKAFQAAQSNPKQYQPAMVNTLAGLIQQQNESRRKSSNDQLKFDADINKTYAETGKIQNEGTGKGLENSQKKYGALNQIFQSVAQTGNKSNALLGLMHANQAGLITPEEFMQQRKVVEAMTPEQLMEYGSGISFGNAKDPASLLFTSADNQLDNQTQLNIANENRQFDYDKLGADENYRRDVLGQDDSQFWAGYEQKDAHFTSAQDLEKIKIAAQKQKVANETPEQRMARMDNVIGSADATRQAARAAQDAANLISHPGIGSGTGLTSAWGKVPGTDARDFHARLENLKSQVFLPTVKALQGMGALSNAEGEKISAAVANLDPSIGEEGLKQQLTVLAQQMAAAAKVAKSRTLNYASRGGTIPLKKNQLQTMQYMPATNSDLEKAAKELGMTTQEVMKFLRQ